MTRRIALARRMAIATLAALMGAVGDAEPSEWFRAVGEALEAAGAVGRSKALPVEAGGMIRLWYVSDDPEAGPTYPERVCWRIPEDRRR